MTIVALIPTILSLICTIIIALIGWGFRATVSSLKNEIINIEKMVINQGKRVEKLEDDLNDVKSDFPLLYVLRDEYVRTLTNVETRIAGMDSKLDRLLERSVRGDKTNG